MAVLPVVFRAGFRLAGCQSHAGRALPQPVQTLQRKAHALHALLSLVSPQDPPAVAGPAVPGDLHKLRLVSGFNLLELLSLVQTQPCLRNSKTTTE